jgi:hypothetical protein
MEKNEILKSYPNDCDSGHFIRNNPDLVLIDKQDLINIIKFIKINTLIDLNITDLEKSKIETYGSIANILKNINHG